jgi:integrase
VGTPERKSNKRQSWPRIRPVTHKSGQKGWVVDGRIRGRGERHFYKTRAEAETKAEQLRLTRKNQGTAGLALPERARVEAAECIKRLETVGATLTEAVEFFIRHARPEAGAGKVSDIIKEFLKEKASAGRRASYLRMQKSVLGNFAKEFGSREIHTIGHSEINNWIMAHPWKLRTRKNYQTDLSNFFSFATRRGYCASNPLVRLEKVTLDDLPPGILKVEQVIKTLNVASSFDEGVLLPYVAIGLFAGLRADEFEKLDWNEVSLAHRTIEVKGAKAKSRQRRIVAMSDNLHAWLRDHVKSEGAIAPRKGHGHRWARLRALSGVDPWPHNALRHSFGSYHVAFHQNAPKTSLEMGHDNPNQLFQSYRELVRPSDAQKYWSISPVSSEKVVAFPGAA